MKEDDFSRDDFPYIYDLLQEDQTIELSSRQHSHSKAEGCPTGRRLIVQVKVIRQGKVVLAKEAPMAMLRKPSYEAGFLCSVDLELKLRAL